jgi:hypothetical protein
MLDDKSKVLAIACMLIASRNDGQIPNDPEYIKRVAYLKSTPNFKPLILCGFLESASNCLQALATARPEESREETEESREDHAPPSKIERGKYGEQGLVLLSDEEVEKLKARFGEDKAFEYVEKLDAYIGSKGKKYKSHFSTILSWSLKDARP